MRHTTALIAILASILLPASSPSAIETRGMSTHARIFPVTLSPSTEVFVTFDSWRFDGSWTVVVFCPESKSAPASAYRFTVGVKDGVLHGERGAVGSRGWMTLDGTIQPDGVATLSASGSTNDSDELRGLIAAETSDTYRVAARFEGSHGLGGRIDGRHCTLKFSRQ
jgi:hypothetical protein